MVFGRERLESRHEKADIGPPAAGKDMGKKRSPPQAVVALRCEGRAFWQWICFRRRKEDGVVGVMGEGMDGEETIEVDSKSRIERRLMEVAPP